VKHLISSKICAIPILFQSKKLHLWLPEYYSVEAFPPKQNFWIEPRLLTAPESSSNVLSIFSSSTPLLT